MKKIYTVACGLCLAISSQAQLAITDSLDVSSLSSLLQGLGVTVSNVTVNCAPAAMGQFYGNGEMGIGQGLLLTSGSAAGVADYSSTFVSGQNGWPGDPDLDMDLGGGTATQDACGLQFDCVPVGDTLLFNFSFGSEEYPEFVGSFNDAFAIYLSGPGYPTPTNVAAIPGGTIVSINNVNAGVNSMYYHDNTGGQYVAYDGFTTNLTAFAVVLPGETYHFKVVVADALDQIYDSGVFLEAFSFRSTQISTGITTHQAGALTASQYGDDLMVHLAGPNASGHELTVVDVTGSAVLQKRMNSVDATIDISALRQGMYLVRLLDSPVAPVRFVKN